MRFSGHICRVVRVVWSLGIPSERGVQRASNDQTRALRSSSVPARGRRRSPEILVDPFHPPSLHVALAHGIHGVMSGLWVTDEARLHAVVLERVIELER